MLAIVRRNNLVVLSALVCLHLPVQADQDPRVPWLRENAVPVRSIDPADDDFTDLRPLIALIGDARVVGLGEQTHGDGATFDGKIRLIRFLHQVMGFDVLVWESGMYDCHLVEQAIRRGEPPREAWRKGIFGVWGASEQVQPLFDYIEQTRASDFPLEIAGMDSQMTGRQTRDALRDHVLDLLERAGNPEPMRQTYEVLQPRFADIGWSPLPELSEQDRQESSRAARRLVSELERVDGAFHAVASGRERSLLARALRNFDAMFEMVYWMKRYQDDRTDMSLMQRYSNAREPAMAETMIWLARERYPDRKLIVWAASTHLAYDTSAMEWRDEGDEWVEDRTGWEPMGAASHRALGDEMYVIDFIAYEGDLGSVAGWSRPLEPAEKGTIDALCHETGEPYLFVDLRSLPQREGGAWLRQPQVARPRGYAPMRADWGRVCDAFFFTDRMYPSTAVESTGERKEGKAEDGG